MTNCHLSLSTKCVLIFLVAFAFVHVYVLRICMPIRRTTHFNVVVQCTFWSEQHHLKQAKGMLVKQSQQGVFLDPLRGRIRTNAVRDHQDSGGKMITTSPPASHPVPRSWSGCRRREERGRSASTTTPRIIHRWFFRDPSRLPVGFPTHTYTHRHTHTHTQLYTSEIYTNLFVFTI